MKNIKINTKKLLIVLTAGFVLVGTIACTNKNDSQVGDNYKTESIQFENNNESKPQTEDKIYVPDKEQNNSAKKEENQLEQSTNNENNIVENSTTEKVYTSNDQYVINYFNDIERNVDTQLQNEKDETVKDKLKGTFITIVDFLFYDSEINGIKFDDLTEGAKQNILETVSSIDNKIMTKYPNYKEEISTTTSNAYNKASDLIRKGANNIKEFSKEKLGEENYNAIVDAKDELVYYTKNAVSIIGDIAGSIWETSKSKIKTWYENFRN